MRTRKWGSGSGRLSFFRMSDGPTFSVRVAGMFVYFMPGRVRLVYVQSPRKAGEP